MNQSDPANELLELCDKLLDGELTAAERERLESLVLSDASLRRRYVEAMHLHASLHQSASRVSDLPFAEVLRGLPDDIDEDVTDGPNWLLRIAAGIALAAGIIWFAGQNSTRTVAMLVETNGARWESSSLPTITGASLEPGRLRLADGVARIRFQSGAEVSLEGPADLEITGSNACFLHTGALVAHVPEEARGFTVGTANAKLIDHGTDFGISTDAKGQAQVQVLQGEVELQHQSSGETLRLLSKESAQVTSDRFSQDAKMDGEPDRYAFSRAVGGSPRALVLTSAIGNGDAAYVVSPNSPLHSSDTLLLVKNGPGESYRRKAFLRFDLASLKEREIKDAALTLNFEATGFGYASLTGECVFAVYGLTEDAQDGWAAETLTWQNAPAFDAEAGAVDNIRAVKLGTFTTPRGVVSGTFGIEGAALRDFLKQDANGLATLIIVRETLEPKQTGAVHGFAGNRHPTLAPPALRLTVE
jgi:hypothetical protein